MEPCIRCEESICPVEGLEGSCLLFIGSKNGGYGQVRRNGRLYQVHRYVWERDVGPIPDGMKIDHRCRNRSCINVKHLRVVTHQVNSTENVIGSAWQINKNKTHCKNGHVFDEENTVFRVEKGPDGRPYKRRRCKICAASWSLKSSRKINERRKRESQPS